MLIRFLARLTDTLRGRWRGFLFGAARVRFGHAFPNPRDPHAPDPVLEACELLEGRATLAARPPTNAAVVTTAERLLKIDPARRPVYAYIGCLHPALGRVGLIIERQWFDRDPHGVTRCDSGGLAGRMGSFAILADSEAADGLVGLSFTARGPWERALKSEIRQAFGTWRAYVEGMTPDRAVLRDVRGRCIEYTLARGDELDRRVWTWEARAFDDVELRDVAAVVLAPEAFKEMSARLHGRAPPSGTRFLVGHVDHRGVHYFREDQVYDAFLGGARA